MRLYTNLAARALSWRCSGAVSLLRRQNGDGRKRKSYEPGTFTEEEAESINAATTTFGRVENDEYVREQQRLA